jgi:hypothetical protein
MNGFVAPLSDSSRADPVQIGSSLGVFRQEADNHIYLRTSEGDIDLGYGDTSVSRLRTDGAPVQFYRENDAVFVQNVDNANDVEVRYLRSTEVLEKGEYTKLRKDCVVEPGFNTELLVTIESTAESDTKPANGPPPYVVVKSRCKALTLSTQSSDHETIIQTESLLTAVKKYEIDVEEYDTVVNDLQNELDMLRQTESLREDGELGDSRREHIERLAAKIADLYALHE